jgi:hypothetical protein
LARILIVVVIKKADHSLKYPMRRIKNLRPCDQHIKEALVMADQMMALADAGDIDREDVGCGVLYGIIRDAAFKIKQLAEKEKAGHIKKGWWK